MKAYPWVPCLSATYSLCNVHIFLDMPYNDYAIKFTKTLCARPLHLTHGYHALLLPVVCKMYIYSWTCIVMFRQSSLLRHWSHQPGVHRLHPTPGYHAPPRTLPVPPLPRPRPTYGTRRRARGRRTTRMKRRRMKLIRKKKKRSGLPH